MKFQVSKIFYFALIFKVSCGFLVGWVYLYFYTNTGDTEGFFHDGWQISKLAKTDFFAYLQYLFTNSVPTEIDLPRLTKLNPRAVLMSKFTSLAYLLGFGNYWLATIPFSIFSFSGLWAFGKRLRNSLPALQNYIYFTLFFLPTFAFWTSGILKESVLIGILGWLFAWLLDLNNWQRKKPLLKHKTALSIVALKLFFAIAFLYILFQMKYYYLAVLVPSAGILVLGNWLDNYFPLPIWQKLAWLGTVGFLFVFLASWLHPNLNLDKVIEAIVVNHHKMAEQTENEGNLIQLLSLKPNLASLLLNAPQACFEGLFRPYIWEQGHIFKRWTAIENSALFFFILATAIQIPNRKIKADNSNLLIASCLFVLTLAILLPLSAPNLGNLMRYRTGFLPTLLLLLGTVWVMPRK